MSRQRREKVRPRVLPNDACPTCGTMMKEARGKRSLPINGEEVSVSSTFLKCPKCGEIMLRFDEAVQVHQHALELYRQKYGLLSVEDIRNLRERLDLKQAELAQLLRLGANTVSRWESGRNVQTGAMDVLLRLVRDVPGSLEYLRAHSRPEERSAPRKRVREATGGRMAVHGALTSRSAGRGR